MVFGSGLRLGFKGCVKLDNRSIIVLTCTDFYTMRVGGGWVDVCCLADRWACNFCLPKNIKSIVAEITSFGATPRRDVYLDVYFARCWLGVIFPGRDKKEAVCDSTADNAAESPVITLLRRRRDASANRGLLTGTPSTTSRPHHGTSCASSDWSTLKGSRCRRLGRAYVALCAWGQTMG